MVHPAAHPTLTFTDDVVSVTDSYGRLTLYISPSTTGFFLTIAHPDNHTDMTIHLGWDMFRNVMEWFTNQPVPH